MESQDLQTLVGLYGEAYVSKRLRIQIDHAANVLGPGVGSFHFENMERLIAVFGRLIKLVGLWEKGYANMRTHRVVHNQVTLPTLPPSLDGFKILHLSDLHLDVFEGMGEHLGRLVSNLEFDLALLTGDFRYQTHSDYYPVFREIERLSPWLKCTYGTFGILGNHDFLEFVPHLERHGIRMLLNEAEQLEISGDQLWVVGLDDAHFYGLHDYERAFRQVPAAATKILMIHSPETLENARTFKADFILSGHTHAGQVCLPGGFALWMNAYCARQYCKGPWLYHGIPGYTSSGVGSSGLPLRFNCPPEIVVHHLCAYRGSES
jgi:uncharacterized protein